MSNFSDITIDLSDGQRKELIEIYVRDKLRPESQSIFNEQLSKGDDDLVLCNALHDAIINDVIVDCIQLAVEMEENEDL